MKKIALLLAASVLAFAACKVSEPCLEEVAIPGPVRPINAYIQKPALRPGQKVPFVIICHGLTGNHIERHLTGLADSLQAKGIGSVRFDFNGHGMDYANFTSHTISKEISEALAVYDYAAALPWVDTKRIGLTGHSQGGFVAGVTAGELGADKIACLVLLAPAACIYNFVGTGNFFGFRFNPDELEDLSAAAKEDPEAPKGLPLWGSDFYISWDYMIDALTMNPWTLTARYTGPTCIVQGTADDPALIVDSKAYCDYMPQIKYIELEGLDHCYTQDLPLQARTACDYFVENLK